MGSNNILFYMKNCHAEIFVYDAFKPENFQSLARKIAEFQGFNPSAIIYIVGNKTDLIHQSPADFTNKTRKNGRNMLEEYRRNLQD